MRQLESLSESIASLKEELKRQHVRANAMTGRRIIISLLFGVEFFDIELADEIETKVDIWASIEKDMLRPVTRTTSFDRNVMHHPYDLLFPINALRNLAISQCRTDLVMSIDADFVPSYGALKRLGAPKIQLEVRANVDVKNPQITERERRVLVVPAFELLKNSDNQTIRMESNGFSESGLPNRLDLACRDFIINFFKISIFNLPISLYTKPPRFER